MNLSLLNFPQPEPVATLKGKTHDEWVQLAAVWAVRAVDHIKRGEYPEAMNAHRVLCECRINAAKTPA